VFLLFYLNKFIDGVLTINLETLPASYVADFLVYLLVIDIQFPVFDIMLTIVYFHVVFGSIEVKSL
jgi:hypothetical protein